MKLPPVSGQVQMFSPDPESGVIVLGLKGGEVLTIHPGTRAAVSLYPEPLLILDPRTPKARALLLPAPLAEVLAASFPLAQAIKEGQGAKHEA